MSEETNTSAFENQEAEITNEETQIVNEIPEIVVEEIAEELPVVEETIEETIEEATEEVAEETIEEVAQEELPVAEETIEEIVEEAKEEIAQEPVQEEIPVIEEKPIVKEVVKQRVDWNTLGKDKEIYSAKERENLESLYSETLNQITDHEVIIGTVVGITSREVFINIGFKSDGIIPASEFRYNPNLKVGDNVEVYVESQEDSTGQLQLSHKKAKLLKSWDRVNQAFETDEIITGHIVSRTKGGLIVEVFGLEAFLPGSQIDVKPIRDYDIFVDKTMEFKVVKINHEFKNVVVSHKALIEDELEAQKVEIIARLEKGQVLEGTVKNITTYGVFIDLGGVDGLIHITDLSWGRINHPEEVVKLDEKIQVVILDFDDSKKRIALGLKQLTPHPWDSLDANLNVGDKVKGKVVVLADYGAFIEIAQGVEGLIHVSEMSWSQHLRTAQDFLKVGDDVEAIILTLDKEARKMSLGIKQLIPDPWASITEKYPIGSKHTSVVRNFTTFGIFVELEEGVDGLIHISDLSWNKKIKHPAEFTKVGEPLEVVVLDIDTENRRFSLGHKQLEENPWEVYENVFVEGSIHKGTITTVTDKGLTINLPDDVEGFCPSRHAVKEDGSNMKVGEVLDFKVIEFNKTNKRIVVSHSKVYADVAAAEKAKEFDNKSSVSKKSPIQELNESNEVATLGDLAGLADLKSKMEEDAEK